MSGSLAFAENDLHDLGVRLLAIDRPGPGRSSPHPDATRETWAADLSVLIERLELRNPLTVGFSQGARGLTGENRGR